MRPAFKYVTFESAVQEGIDQLEDLIQLLQDATSSTELAQLRQDPMQTNSQFDGVAGTAFDEAQTASTSDTVQYTPSIPSVGDNIELYWDIDHLFYPRTVSSITTASQNVIGYEDGEDETLKLSTETWRFQPSASINDRSSTLP